MKPTYSCSILLLVFFISYVPVVSFAQRRLSKSDAITFNRLKAHVAYLTTDPSIGRRIGTDEEKKAASYIQEQFKAYGLIPQGDNGTYLQQFTIREGEEVHASSFLMLDGTTFASEADFIVFPWSSTGSLTSMASPFLQEKETPWFWDLKEILEQHSGNTSIELERMIYDRALEVQQKGASALLVYNSSGLHTGLRLRAQDSRAAVTIPVLFLLDKPTLLLRNDLFHTWDLGLRIHREAKIRNGTNVVGLIDFGAPATILITAHYDQMVYDEFQVSSGSSNRIYNNSGGAAALIEMARLLKKGPATCNYLFIAFSGEEQGLLGSRHFMDQPVLTRDQIKYVLNVDGISGLNDSTRRLYLCGFQSSQYGQQLFPREKKPSIRLVPDSSAAGAYLLTAFYQKRIPSVLLHTGYQNDIEQRRNGSSSINFAGTVSVLNCVQRIIKKLENEGKLLFQQPEDVPQESLPTARAVTMGIQPDDTFGGGGIQIKSVYPHLPADAAGIQSGDVLLKVGLFPVLSIQTYRAAISEYQPGDRVQVLIRRNQQEQSLFVRF